MKLTVALVLVEWAAGMLAGVALVHRLHAIGPGFTWLVGGVAAAASALAAAAGRAEPGAAAAWRTGLSILLALVALAEVALARRRLPALDIVAVAVALSAAVAAGVAAGGGLSVARAVGGAAFLGAVTHGMVIGHWYLGDPSLPRTVIRRLDVVFLATVAVETAALVAPPGMLGQILDSGRSGFTAVLPGFWVALLVLTAILGVAVLGALRERSYAGVMAATGLLYLAVITAFGVDILAKALISGAL